MSSLHEEDYDDAPQSGGPTANIRLYLRASNLPRSIVGQQPDTLARVSLLNPQNGGDSQLPPPVPPPDEDGESDGSAAEGVLDETEVVQRSSNPRWTSTFATQYEYGSQLLFFVDVYEVRTTMSMNGFGASSMGSFVNKKGMKLLGRAVFDAQDVLGSRGNVKARRLRKGGVVYAHMEIEQQGSSINAPTPRSLSSSLSSTAPSSGRMLKLRLRGDSLVLTQSKIKLAVAKNIQSKPDTYYEISRPSTSSMGMWIVLYRSPPVKESVSPTWDEAMLDFGSFHSRNSEAASPSDDLSAYPVRITVYKVKRKKCKEIGSFETTVQSLLEAKPRFTAVTGFEDGQSAGDGTADEDVEAGGRTFRLRPTAEGGVDRSGEVTGRITVVDATIESSDEAMRRSQRFLSVTDDDEDDEDGSCPMGDGDSGCASVHQHQRALPTGPRPKFSDYVNSGKVNVDFCVAIDFTSSNGDPRIPGTQHYSRDGMMNDYEEAIVALGSTIKKYSSSHQYPVWGFGAKYGGKVRHLFQLGGSPTASGTQGVLDAYRTVFETDLIMSGPTEIYSVLNQAAARSKKFYNAPPSDTNMQYCVLLVLTDGIVNDLRKTKELLQSYRKLQLPLSVIVVGIGRADFSEFHRWNNEPYDIRGRFKFVEFREHQFDPDTLSRKALLNVPHDIVDYFLARNILPQ